MFLPAELNVLLQQFSLLRQASISKDRCFCSYLHCNESPLLALNAHYHLPTTTAVNKPRFARGMTGHIRIKGPSGKQCYESTSQLDTEPSKTKKLNYPLGQRCLWIMWLIMLSNVSHDTPLSLYTPALLWSVFTLKGAVHFAYRHTIGWWEEITFVASILTSVAINQCVSETST